MDDQKEEREGESGGEQAAAGGCEGQQVTFLPTVRLAAFGHLGAGSNPAKCSPYVQDGQGGKVILSTVFFGMPIQEQKANITVVS